jgi:sulfate adenylyltransferase
MSGLIRPHGGRLVNRILTGKEKEELAKRINGLKRIHLNRRQISDLEMISIGGFSPLEGFMGEEDYRSVVKNMRLANGLPWPIPITLQVSKEIASQLREGDEVALFDEADNPLGVLLLKEIYSLDKEEEARLVYGTTDTEHPGVAYLYQSGDLLLGGEINLLEPIKHNSFLKYRLSPSQTREFFIQRGWRRVVGFQTRNPIHRAHEYIQKCALEVVDGLFIHPIVWETKRGDIPAEVRMKSYEVLLEKYYPKERVLLAVNPAAMRYAGPREAIFHAIVRKNYGCTHFIVGRDHAGVGNYYRPFDAQYIFDEFEPRELEIIPFFFDHTFYCKECKGMASSKTCPHNPEEHITLSGTRVRQMLKEGKLLPEEISRPEVARILMEEMRVQERK